MFPGTTWLHRWAEVLKELGSKREMLLLLCTMRGYAVGLLAARCGSQQVCAWVQKVLRQFERRKVYCGILNIEMLFSRSQNLWQTGEWLGVGESEYISPDLVIFFM